MERYSGDLTVTTKLLKVEVQTMSQVRRPPTTKIKTRPYDIPNSKRLFDLVRQSISSIKALVFFFFHGLGASSSTAALGFLELFFGAYASWSSIILVWDLVMFLVL
ncbi:hypothetical protein F8M41_004140 [Gigaspora margarita]|uniref:Uncharacterized protein n=1 Tax=Gigaspora margarita TaxID=4874 RepID=A0A8H3XA71_GIGMA|nr:hypothetical protein F8M41_004140 [Gigaspora margarita]